MFYKRYLNNNFKVSLLITMDDNKKKIDTALFDQTLKQIEKTLENLGEKIAPELKSKISESVVEEKNSSDEEHAIDNTHLRMEELHNFSSKQEIKKNSFGFYTYLALIIGIIFAIYEMLNIFKDYIILKYPVSEPYIAYFYEVIEILAYLIMNFISFIKNLF